MNLGPLISKRFFSTEGKGKGKDMLHINTLFEKNSLDLWLPSISQNKVDETQRFMFNPKFIITLVNVLNNLDKSYTYKLCFLLFLHTNDKDKEVTFLLPPESGIDPSTPMDEMLRVATGIDILYKMCDYRGYHVFHSNELDLELVKDFEKYVHHVLETLGRQVRNTNENLYEDGFIEFKKSVLLKITRFDNSRDLGLSKKGVC